MSDEFSHLNDPVWLPKHEAGKVFLDRTIFAGLVDLRPWFDAATIKHFHADEFRTVIERCTKHHVQIIGIEVFSPRAELETVEIVAEDANSNAWCLELVDRFRDQPELSFCASYDCDKAVE